MRSNAEAVARTLADAGITTAFGIPGGEVVALIDACRRAGIRFFLTGHEASAAFMADVTGRITERPGVCIATLGPGAMNLVLGVANAALDRSPLLALTATVPASIRNHYTHQRLPLTRIFGAFCKMSTTLDGHATDDVTAYAIQLATSPPFGPVHLALAADLATKSVSANGNPADLVSPKAASAGAGIEELRGMLREARRPLLLVGLGCLSDDVGPVRRYVAKTGIPYVVMPKAKGILPEDSQGFLGVAGGMALDDAMLDILAHADLLLGVGFDPVECDKTWYIDRVKANISRASTRAGSYRPTEVIGDIGRTLELLADDTPSHAWLEEELSRAQARLRPTPIRSGQGVSPLEAVWAMRAALPRATVLTCDVGSHKYYAGQFWQSYEPHTFFMSNGLSAMGYGLPAAIAAKLQFPDRPVVALVGDGGLLMMLHNLVFLRQYGVSVVVVCFVDESLSLIRIAQQRRGLEPYGVDFAAPDFSRVAEGFGLRVARAETIGSLTEALQRGIEEGGPMLISVPINREEYEAYC